MVRPLESSLGFKNRAEPRAGWNSVRYCAPTSMANRRTWPGSGSRWRSGRI